MSALLRMRRFLLNFSVVNLLVLLVLALCFLLLIPTELTASIAVNQHQLSSYSFIGLGLIGQIGLIGLLSAAVICAVIMGLRFLFKSDYYDFVLILITAFLMTLLVFFIGIDFAVYRLIGYHLTVTFWNVLFSGVFFQVIVLSNVEWFALFVGFCLLLSVEVALAVWLWQRGFFVFLSRLSLFLSALIILAAGFSYTFYFMNDAPDRDLPQLAKLIPYFMQVARRLHTEKIISKPLQYPQHKLLFKRPSRPLNIILIVIDTWRADMLNPDVTPNIARFALKSIRFSNHFSGGNFTQPGIFSLLYGLTPNYWYLTLRNEQGPMLIHQLLKDQYTVKVFPSASPRFPDFIDTAFHAVPQAWHDTPGANSTERDLNITNEFEQFLATRNPSRPFFGFLFYDAVHNWCGSRQSYATPFEPAIKTCNRLSMSNNANPLPYLNRYRNAAHYDDQLIGNILNQLKQQNLLKNTIVMITADHGEEFNDSHRNIWGHGSAFDRYQLQVPFVMYWPGKEAQVIAYRTSHYDVVPTLMSDVLDCVNPSSDYSVGRSLFATDRPPYIIVGSYESYAKLFPHSVEIAYPGGYDVTDNLDGQPLK